jgi:hypothetical protein
MWALVARQSIFYSQSWSTGRERGRGRGEKGREGAVMRINTGALVSCMSPRGSW